MRTDIFEMDRRTLLKTLGSVAAASAFSKFSVAAPPAGKRFNGLFPIASSPFTPDNKLDLDCLGNEVKFCNRGGRPGADLAADCERMVHADQGRALLRARRR